MDPLRSHAKASSCASAGASSCRRFSKFYAMQSCPEAGAVVRNQTTPRKMHLAFVTSSIHMDGRWRQPHSWVGHTYPDVAMFDE
jgi:hypothetical protein